MFKSARWKSDKSKIKAVFKLQFHATQVSLSGGDSLMISVIPADLGKPTAKLEKVKVDNGCCCWEKPVYETVKFTQDPKTGNFNKKIYHFIIATALSKFGILGEVSFDFANYAGATKLSTVSLPLKTAKFEAVLHVSIERIQDSVDKREVEEGENLKHGSQNQSLITELSSSDVDEKIKIDLQYDGSTDRIITHVSELRKQTQGSTGSDVTISGSDRFSGLDTFQESGTKNNIINEDYTNFISSQVHVSLLQKATPDASTAIYEEQQRLQSEWAAGSAPDVSTDDSSNSPREALITERYQDTSDILIEKLKSELAVLARQSEVSELELQTLRKNIVKENRRGQDLSREIISLKEERDGFRKECERLKDLQTRAEAAKVRNRLQVYGGDPRALLEELRQELIHEKDLNATLRVQLQKTQESNSELIFAVRELDELLEAKNSETIDLSNNSAKCQSANSSHVTNSICDANVDEDQKALEELVKDHSNAKDAYQLEKKVMDLYGELDTCRRDRDDLEMQMEHLSLDYEILKQENHDISYKLEQGQLQEQLKMQYECSTSYATLSDLEAQIESLESDLQKLSKEFSGSSITISKLENHVKRLEEELENKEQGFEADLEVLINAKVEQEKRAIRAEETLRKAQWQNFYTAERLQNELKGIYLQISSTCDVNDKLATNALAKASELLLEKNYLKERLQQAKKELQSVKDLYEVKLFELPIQIHSKTTQVERMQAEIEYKSIEIETQRKHAEETQRLLSEEISMLQSEIGRLTQENSLFSEKEKPNETVLEQMKASTDDLSEEIIVFGSQIERLTEENSVFSEQEEKIQNLSFVLEQMMESIKETEVLVLRGITETNELELTSALLQTELEKLQKEFNTIRSVKDETESIVGNLQSEVENLKTKCGELKRSVLEDELEKQMLRKQVLQLTDDVKIREDILSTAEKEMKDKNSQASVVEVVENRNAKLVSACVSMEDVNLIEKISLLEVAGHTEDLNFNDEETEAVSTAEDFIITQSTSVLSGCPLALRGSNNYVSSDQKLESIATCSRDHGNLGELSHEMTLMKARNQSMEGELKDMQERYSTISIKFAEVEGERQKLDMRLRSIKNSKKRLS